MNEQESAIRSDQIEFMVSRNQSALRKLIWSGLCQQESLFKVQVNGLPETETDSQAELGPLLRRTNMAPTAA